MHFWQVGFVLLVATFLGGCGGDRKVEVSGTVTVDGAPVDVGVVRFEPAAGGGSPDEVPIAKGTYQGQVRPGDKKVTIDARRVVRQEHISGDPNNPLIDVTEALALDASQTLTCTVGRSGGQHNFSLKSAGAPP